MTCKDGCKDSILNGQKSVIGEPICHDNCGSETDCEGIQTYSDCVGVNPALSCIDTSANTSLSDVLVAIDTKLCETQDSNCQVKVSSTDVCCGFLQEKLTAGTGISITKQTASPSGCESLLISTNPGTLVWNNLILPAPLTTIAGYQIPQYSDKDALGRVWFRGSFTFSSAFAKGAIINLSTVIPANSRPLYIRTFWNGKGEAFGSVSAQVLILPTGVIQIKNNSAADLSSKSIVSFDGFWIDNN